MFNSIIDEIMLKPLPEKNEGDVATYHGKKIEELSLDDMLEIINDFSNSPALIFPCLQRITKEDPEKMTEIVENYKSQYINSSAGSIEEVLKFLVLKCEGISPEYRFNIIMALFYTAETVIKNEPEDEIEDISDFNLVRFKQLGDVLESCCRLNFETFASPCKITILKNFTKHTYFFEYLKSYTERFIDSQLPDEYKYTSLLSLEKYMEKYQAENVENTTRNDYGIWAKHITRKDEEISYSPEFSEYISTFNQVLLGIFIEFLQVETINLNFRVLCAQNCLVKSYISIEEKVKVMDFLLKFLKDTSIKEQQTADIADVILQYGDDNSKVEARGVINRLGFQHGGKSIFDNAQNVHTKEIEESVMEILENLSKRKIYEVNGESVRADFIFSDITESAKNSDLLLDAEDQEKILFSLKRINLDRARYSRLNYTLESILIRVWSYIQKHEYKEELNKRLLQELIDMSGWCSSGLASRLLNTISGFGEFSIKIGWKDQIIANFNGRLAYRINSLPEAEKIEVSTGFICKSEDEPRLRRIFLDYFIKTLPYIREEMWHEFREYMDDADFDLCFRSAISFIIDGVSLDNSEIKHAVEKQKNKEEKQKRNIK